MTGTPFPADMIALLRWMTSCLGGTLVPMGTGTRLGMSARVQMDQLFDRYCSLDDRKAKKSRNEAASLITPLNRRAKAFSKSLIEVGFDLLRKSRTRQLTYGSGAEPPHRGLGQHLYISQSSIGSFMPRRSIWKGSFVDAFLLRMKKKRDLLLSRKIWSRRSSISPEFVDCSVLIYNGKTPVRCKITEGKVGHKFGEFASTRKRRPSRTFKGKGRKGKR
uniref:Uncharacterized protein LOC114913512 n=1 Tax=Elaeis guineensis var. tenera TaxID=51953 RepID=A0A8N4EYX7_ELAGV|nr:uncharacterized protein LOC114913512 [Elaeis guineensis]